MFLSNFYPCRFAGKYRSFMCLPIIRYCRKVKLPFVAKLTVAEPKVAVFAIFEFSGLQRTFLSNFYHAAFRSK